MQPTASTAGNDAMEVGQSLIAELESAIQSGSNDKRVDTLRRITDLFVADADRFNDQQIGTFDNVLSHLIKSIEGKALQELSRRLAPIDNAPPDVVRHLAGNDDIAVAEPLLTQSARLNDGDLIEIAGTKTQAHLLAISSRSRISTGVTDVLLQRGDHDVFHKLAGNSGAKFSDRSFAALVDRSGRDEQLAEKVGRRADIPQQLFRELLARATEAVQSRLVAAAGPGRREQIQRILAAISETASRASGVQSEQDFAKAQARLIWMQSAGELNDAAIAKFAVTSQYADIVAAISLRCEAPLNLVAKLLESEHREAFLIPCKAAGLEWATARAILTCRTIGRTMSAQDLDAARTDYAKLSLNNARRILRFWQVRQTVLKDAAAAPARPH